MNLRRTLSRRNSSNSGSMRSLLSRSSSQGSLRNLLKTCRQNSSKRNIMMSSSNTTKMASNAKKHANDEHDEHLDMTEASLSTHHDTHSIQSSSATSSTSLPSYLPSAVLQIIEKVEKELIKIDASIDMYETLVAQTNIVKENHLALAQARSESGNTAGAELSLRKVQAANDKLGRLQEALHFLQHTKASANNFFERCSSTTSQGLAQQKDDVAVLCSLLRRQCKEICAAVSKAQAMVRRKPQPEQQPLQPTSSHSPKKPSLERSISVSSKRPNHEELSDKLQPMFFL